MFIFGKCRLSQSLWGKRTGLALSLCDAPCPSFYSPFSFSGRPLSAEWENPPPSLELPLLCSPSEKRANSAFSHLTPKSSAGTSYQVCINYTMVLYFLAKTRG